VSVVECQKGEAAEFKIFSSESARTHILYIALISDIIFSHSSLHTTYYYRYLIGTVQAAIYHAVEKLPLC